MNIIKSKAIPVIIFLGLSSGLSANLVKPTDSLSESIQEQTDYLVDGLECLKGKFGGKTGELSAIEIPINFAGRPTIGDVNNDGQPDIVMSSRTQIAAYDVCGKVLWQQSASTNWDYRRHVFWGWSSFGWVGDADGDGEGEFLHIGADWQTLYVRNGADGEIEKTIDLGPGQWMYVLLGRRIEDKGNETTRLFVTGPPGDQRIKSIDIRSGVKFDWSFNIGKIANAYLPPQVTDLNQSGDDEIVHASVAVDTNGEPIWTYNARGLSVLGAFHTLQVRDIDPDKEGLEATYSVYGPIRNKPSIVSVAYSNPDEFNWIAGSNHGHQHVVGDFVPSMKGLETLVRYHNGINHYLIDAKGNILNNYKRPEQKYYPRYWNKGELVQGIEWDEKPGTEILSIERHTRFKEIPAMIITTGEKQPTGQGDIILAVSDYFHGGFTIPKEDADPALPDGPSPDSWFPQVERGPAHDNDGPYEGNGHAVDLIGDGREEVLAMADRKVMIYFNSGDAGVEKRWGDHEYMSRKKLWCNVYNPR